MIDREQELRHLIDDVRQGQLPRRSFIQHLVGLGLTAPMASMLLLHAGVAQAQTIPYKPTKRLSPKEREEISQRHGTIP